MTLLEIQAIRALPEEYVKEGVRAVCCEHYIVAACPYLPALFYSQSTREWCVMDTGKPIAEAMGLPVDSRASPRLTEFDAVMWEQARIAREGQLKT